MSDKMLLDLVGEVRSEQKDIKKELIEQTVLFREHLKQDEEMYREIQAINKTLHRNTLDIEKHIMRTNILQDDQVKIVETLGSIRKAFESMTRRIEILEEPNKVKDYLYNKWMRSFKIIAAGGAAFGVVSKYLGWW
jgi:uncharacterized protein YwgA